jgi:RNA polymerase sigma factor (sigma-70 family)
MRSDGSGSAGGAPADPLGREQVAAMLAAVQNGLALHTVGGLDEMAAESDDITHEESELLQAQSLAARGLDEELGAGLRHGRLGGETSSARYLRDLSDRPRLPAAVERRLVEAAQAGDRRAREELVEAFLPLIAGVARVYRGSRTISRLELMQEGVVGLLRALERYDPALGVPFWGYAAWWVRQAMQQLIAELTRPLVLSDRALRQLSQLKRAHGEYLVEHGREPSGNELGTAPVFHTRRSRTCSRSSVYHSRWTKRYRALREIWGRSGSCSLTRSPATPTSSCSITQRLSRSARCWAASTIVSG